MAKQTRTLKQGLDNEADKKGLTGKERHRYIGGAIRNMEKRGEFTIHRRPAAKHKATPVRRPSTAPGTPTPAKKPYEKPTVTKVIKKQAYASPKLAKRERLELVVKKNAAASTATYDAYSLYNRKTGKQHGSGAFRKRGAASQAAKFEMDAFNHPRGVHVQTKTH